MLNKKFRYTILILLLYLTGYAQVFFEGSVYESDGVTPIQYAVITDLNSHTTTITNASGQFELNTSGFPVDLQVSSFGYKDVTVSTSEIPFNIIMEQDPLLLESIVITDYQSKQRALKSKNAISLISLPLDKSLTGIASLIEEVPGVFIDGSLGEVYTRVYTRGISASAEDDIG